MKYATKRSKQQAPRPKPGDFAGIYPQEYCRVLDLALTLSDTEKQRMIDIIHGVRSAGTAAKARSLNAAGKKTKKERA